MTDLIVKKRYPYRGKHYEVGDIHKDCPPKMANVLIYIGKAELSLNAPNKEKKPKVDEPLASDAVKQLADDEGIDLATVRGTGKNGRINKSDVLAYKTRMMTAENSRNTDGSEYRTESMAAEPEPEKTDLAEEAPTEQSTDEDGEATE